MTDKKLSTRVWRLEKSPASVRVKDEVGSLTDGKTLYWKTGSFSLSGCGGAWLWTLK
jgi:hypothetical protein